MTTTLEKQTLKLLIVDDNPEDRETYKRLLRFSNDAEFSFVETESGKGGLDLCQSENPDCIILDYILPDIDGLEFMAQLKQRSLLRPVIMLTGQGDETVAVLAMKEGAENYLVKEHLTSPSLRVAIYQSMKLKGPGSGLKANSRSNGNSGSFGSAKAGGGDAVHSGQGSLVSGVRFLKERVENSGYTDLLTGLCNRNGMEDKIRNEKLRFERNKKPFAMIIADVDGYPAIVKEHGTETGSAVLVRVAQIMEQSCRKLDMIGRWGAERFLILLPETDLQGGSVLAEKLCQRIEHTTFTCNDLKVAVTMSFQVGVYEDETLDVEYCIQQVDQPLH